MNIKQINPKTNRKEKMIQCTNCIDWVFMSNYTEHICPKDCKVTLGNGSMLD